MNFYTSRKELSRQATRTTVFHRTDQTKHAFIQIKSKLIQLWISPQVTPDNHQEQCV